ncbi:MAG TPA: YceI family protein [Steroidobacteraceae bacterium]|nr:YceI family protein [Steroidobacteraceae bacterium]
MKNFLRTTLLLLACVFAVSSNAATNWVMDPQHNTLSFTGTQAGAQFQGSFKSFAADIKFDPTDLATSRFDVTIDLGSVSTQDDDRDETVKGADFFAIAQWPKAHYVTQTIAARDAKRYVGNGKLTLRNVTRDVPITFTFEVNGNQGSLKGSATLRRLDFGVGQGEWKDTSSVGDEVAVKFSLALTKQ